MTNNPVESRAMPPRNGRSSATSDVSGSTVTVDGESEPAPHFPATIPTGRPVIGLVLEGGGALGLAHIGVLRWFDEHHIPIDRLAGTSMGALVGGLYASGRNPAELLDIASGSNLTNVFTLQAPYTDVSYRRREDRREIPQGAEIGLRGGVSLRNSVLADSGLNRFLQVNLSSYQTYKVDFDLLPTPFRCVATDLNLMSPVVFRGGPLADAVRASISIPGVFPPVAYKDHYLIDGAIADNLPADIVKNQMQSDIVIAVHLPTPGFAEGDVGSILGVMTRAFSVGTAQNERVSRKLANLVIEPDTHKFTVSDYASAKDLAQAGYDAAEKQHDALMKYALSETDWSAYVAARKSRERPALGILEAVKVTGGPPGAQADVKRDLKPLIGQPMNAEHIVTALADVQGDGAYHAGFRTFSTGPAADAGATAQNNTAQGASPDTGVAVRLSETRNGPPFLIIGADVSAVSSDVTRTTFDMRLINQDFGGYGSELRSNLRLGFLTQVSTEYYRLLNPKGYFLEPHLGIIRQPVYIWQNQERISERFEQQAGGGLDFGRTFSRNMQAALEWREQVLRWHLTTGSDPSPEVSGSAQTAVAHYAYDSTESGMISPRGYRVDVSAGAIYNSVDSQTAPLLQARTSRTITLQEKNIFGFSAEANTYFRRNITEPLRFTLGGPLRLSSAHINEYRGTDDYLVRAAYLRRIAPLPTGLGQGLYLTLGYEGGEIWSPERSAFLRQDGVGALVAATPLGVITFGGSLGDAGRRKVFFTLGRLF